MNEAMGPNSRVCSVCAKIFEKAPEAKFDICPTCHQKLALPKEQQPFLPSKKPGLMVWGLIVAGIVITVSQVSRIKAAISLLFPPPPIESSALADPKDLCTANLWQISSLIQTDQWPAPNFYCPVTRADYATRSDDGNTVVSCPNPEQHGLKSLRVSKKAPSPEAIQ